MQEVQFMTPLHVSSKRDYLARMTPEKPANMRVAKAFNKDYWDGDRKYGYGGYHYDGRYQIVADAMARHYSLKPNDMVLDIGCGKGYLLHDIQRTVPNIKIQGIDISHHAHEDSKVGRLDNWVGDCRNLPFKDKIYDFTYSINVFHNLGYADLKAALSEMVRVGKEKSYICVESFRNEEELTNLQVWQLTCLSYYSPDDWRQIYEDCGYKGDYEFIYFN